MIKSIHLMVAFVGVLLMGCASNRAFFHNKILIYGGEADSVSYPNSSFIDFYEDTINMISLPFSPSEKIYPVSHVPFLFLRASNSIYIKFINEGKVVQKKYFELSKSDTVQTSTYEFLCDANDSNNWVVTQYTGKDTMMRIGNRKIKCWIFEQKYPYIPEFSFSQRTKIIYLEKKSLVPGQITTIFHRPDKSKPKVYRDEVFKDRLDSVIDRPWNSSDRKWKYPKCWLQTK